MLKKIKKDSKDDMYEKPIKELTKGMQKITIASDSSEGLEEGLEKAKQILKGRFGMDDDDEHECGEDYACGGTKSEDGGIKKKALMKLRKQR